MEVNRKQNSIGGIEHIVWDWNGTLLDDAHICVQSLNTILRKRKMPTIDVQEYREQFSFPVREYYERLGFSFDREDWHELAVEFHQAYNSLAKQARLRPHVHDTLALLKESGYSLAVLSASETSVLTSMMANLNVNGYFTVIQGLSNLYANSKIDLGRTLAQEFRFAPGRTLIVGDTDHDFEVARELGWHCLLVCGGHQTEARLKACGCPVLPDLSAVPHSIEVCLKARLT